MEHDGYVTNMKNLQKCDQKKGSGDQRAGSGSYDNDPSTASGGGHQNGGGGLPSSESSGGSVALDENEEWKKVNITEYL